MGEPGRVEHSASVPPDSSPHGEVAIGSAGAAVGMDRGGRTGGRDPVAAAISQGPLPIIPMDVPFRTPQPHGPAGAAHGMTIVSGAVPVTLQGPKGGYLYARILEAGSLDTLDPAKAGICCGLLPGGCQGLLACGPAAPTQFRFTFSCTSLERPSVSSSSVCIDPVTQKAVFKEELLMKSFKFCGVDALTIRLQTNNATVGEASIPLRGALPSPLAGGLPPRSCGTATSPGNGDCSLGNEDLSVTEETSMHPVEAKNWLPTRRLSLRPPGRPTIGVGERSAWNGPYVDIQLLMMVDSSLPRVVGTTPLMLAVENRQEQLVRAYMSLDVAETCTSATQAACFTVAIEQRCLVIVLMLLDRIKPSHQHLLLAIRLRDAEIVEALLQAGSAPLLYPHPRNARGRTISGGSSMGATVGIVPEAITTPPAPSGAINRSRIEMPPVREPGAPAPVDRNHGVASDFLLPRPRRVGGSPAQVSFGGVNRSSAPEAAESPSISSVSSPPQRRQLTPLALACSLGDVPIVEALCRWAKREKVHIDPTAPLVLGQDAVGGSTGAGPISVGRGGPGAVGEGSGTNAGSVVTSWWDEDESFRDGEPSSRYGDPPMLMAVRGSASISVKLRIVCALARFGFAVDVRSPMDGWTPLLAAVELGSLELTQALVKLGARLSADRHLGFTPLHVAAQMGHWHIVATLTDSMKQQYSRVAAWGPSPQYVSLNSIDSYGRTTLDIALMRYFANPLPCSSDSSASSSGNERQKAVDILREFVNRSPSGDAGVVCGRELLKVLRFLDALPSKKAVGAQFWGSDWESPSPSSLKGGSAVITKAAMAAAGGQSSKVIHDPFGDVEEVLQAVRTLVRAGAQTRWLLQELIQPSTRTDGTTLAPSKSSDFKESIATLGPYGKSSCKYSRVDADEASDMSGDDEPPHLRPSSAPTLM